MNSRPRYVEPATVIAAVTGHYRTTRDALLARSQSHELTRKRYLLMWLLHHRSRLPRAAIARLLSRDRKLVEYGVRHIQKLVESRRFGPATNAEIAKIDRAIAAKLGETPTHLIAMKVAADPAAAHPFEIAVLANHIATEWSRDCFDKENAHERACA